MATIDTIADLLRHGNFTPHQAKQIAEAFRLTLLPIGYSIGVQATNIATPFVDEVRYFGNLLREPTTTAGINRIYPTKNGTITGAEIVAYCGTGGTTETWSMAIMKNGALASSVASASTSTDAVRFTNSALSIAVTTADYIEVRVTMGSWSVAPADMLIAGNLFVSTG